MLCNEYLFIFIPLNVLSVKLQMWCFLWIFLQFTCTDLLKHIQIRCLLDHFLLQLHPRALEGDASKTITKMNWGTFSASAGAFVVFILYLRCLTTWTNDANTAKLLCFLLFLIYSSINMPLFRGPHPRSSSGFRHLQFLKVVSKFWTLT